MTKVHLFKWLVFAGLVLGLSSCGDVINEPAAEAPVLETQEIFDATVFVSTLEVSNGSASRTKKCADVPRSTKRVGADLIQYDCNDQENQLFLFELVDGEDLYFTVKSLASGLCMSVSSTEKLGGNPVVEQTACTGAPNQQFGIIPVSVEDIGYFGIEAGRDSERCLAVKDKSPQNRAPLVTVDCAFNSDLAVARGNRWNIGNYNPAFTTRMLEYDSKKCADVPRFSRRDGTDLIVYRCNDQTNQQFEFLRVSSSGIDGSEFLIRSVSSGLCMTVPDGPVPGKRVIKQRKCTGELDQRFELQVFDPFEATVLLNLVAGPGFFQCLGVEPLETFGGRGPVRDRNNLISFPCNPPSFTPYWILPDVEDVIAEDFFS